MQPSGTLMLLAGFGVRLYRISDPETVLALHA
jgi:hypothetical protein